MSIDQAAANLSDQAWAVVNDLRTDGLLRAENAYVHGEVCCAIARHALGPNWADLCAQRITRVLAGNGWLRSEDAPRARAVARAALERSLRPPPS